MASAVFILDLKGKVLISRNYRGDIPMTAVEKFMPLLLETEEEEQTLTPVITHEGVNYLYIRHNNLYLLAITKKNSDATTILVFLHKLTQVFTEYFKTLEEESIRDNFVIIYELLDEMMDFGYPQTTETKVLQEYITQEGYKLEVQVRPPMAVTNAVSWRTEGIRYRKNEVFLDVVESVNLLANANGNVLRSEILGSVKMRCFLSGMPELRLGLNDKILFENIGRTVGKGKAIEMEDVKFHQCVRLSRFENDRTISFIPPDGEFELMSYRLNTQVKPLIWCEAFVEYHTGRIEYMIKAKAQFKRRSSANNVEILVPVPDDAASPKFKCSMGSASYAPEKSAIAWKIKQFPGSREFILRAHFSLPSVKGEEELDKKLPISVKFEIPYFVPSGIQVRYLKVVEKSGYQALPWVRYITQNGDYHLRMPEPTRNGGPSSLPPI
ncbi:AP-1 adaptor complex mu subunit Apm1 [Basidiobolus ranarum]|uniref:AP-1 adaptor complex mu subunit Apm1 n=1 Tax=Basidiobolus ranarum TaxID=34480 RepID=A0ABR2W3V1_9FUNG